MFNHEPPGYACPLCVVAQGGSTALDSQDDVVERTDATLAMMSSFWHPARPGSVLVLPTAHHENLFDLPPSAGHAVHDAVRRIAIAMRRAYDCAGITVRQNNEPAGDQEVWHFHVHVLPRSRPSELSSYAEPIRASDGARRDLVDKLRAELGRPLLALQADSGRSTACR